MGQTVGRGQGGGGEHARDGVCNGRVVGSVGFSHEELIEGGP